MNNLDFAKQLALLSDFDKYKIGAVVLDKKGNVISFGTNKTKTHPRQKHYAIKAGYPEKQYLHAEVAALVKCNARPHSIVVVRVRGDGSFGNANPCPICRLAAYEAGIIQISYSDKLGNIVTERIQ